MEIAERTSVRIAVHNGYDEVALEMLWIQPSYIWPYILGATDKPHSASTVFLRWVKINKRALSLYEGHTLSVDTCWGLSSEFKDVQVGMRSGGTNYRQKRLS